MAESQIERILHQCSNHFEVLQLKKPSNPIDLGIVRRKYKELALLIHPDKTRVINANEAFNCLTQAYECLANEVTQQNYLNELSHSATVPRAASGWKRRRRQKSPMPPPTTSKASHRRTTHDILEDFEREEEKLAMEEFYRKGFDRSFESARNQRCKRQGASPEEQHYIVRSDEESEERAELWNSFIKSVRRKVIDPRQSETSSKLHEVPHTVLHCCLLCRRQFKSNESLARHNAFSTIHQQNLETSQGQINLNAS